MPKKKPPSLGDASPDFLKQWNASRANPSFEKTLSSALPAEPPVREGIDSRRGLLDSWKKDGNKVRVTKVVIKSVAKSKASPPLSPGSDKSSHSFEGKRPSNLSNNKRNFKSSRADIKSTQPGVQKFQTRSSIKPVITTRKSARDYPSTSHLIKKSWPTEKHFQDKLRDVYPDLSKLQIASATSKFVSNRAFANITEGQSPTTAILGLDFGTAFTKAVIRWEGSYHAVNWTLAVSTDSPYLLSSAFSEHHSGECVLGLNSAAGWQLKDGIKLRILDSAANITDDALADAVIFIALAFRYANTWLRHSERLDDRAINWNLHVGLPTLSWDNNETASVFNKIARAAWRTALMPGIVTRKAALLALSESEINTKLPVRVFPEFACQLYSYLRSARKRDDLHALVDIGAGTVDVAFFNVHAQENGALLPIFAADVQSLGAHYLIAAMAGPDGVRHSWSDADSRISVEDCAHKIGDNAANVSKRRSIFMSAFADMFNCTRARARLAYETSPVFLKNAPMLLFSCGGGSRIPAYKERINMIANESEKVVGVKFQVSSLVRPKDIVGDADLDFDRLSVAYGLSQIAKNIGAILRSGELPLTQVQQKPIKPDRDDDR